MRLLLLSLLSTLVFADELRKPAPYFAAHNERVRRSIHVLREPPTLELKREWDRVSYFAPQGQPLYGAGLFGLAVVGAAHLPGPLFDGKWHLGPALLDGYGVGIGFGGRM